jgi:ribosomal protein L44E
LAALRRQRQEEHEFTASLGYIVRSCLKKKSVGQALVAHACDPSYSGDRDQEDRGSKPARAHSCETLSQNNPSQKRAGRVAQGVGLEFKPQYHKKQKQKQKNQLVAGCQWLMTVILATQEAEIRMQIVHETLSLKYPTHTQQKAGKVPSKCEARSSNPSTAKKTSQLTLGAWVHFKVLYSVPLVCMSVFMAISCCFDYYKFVVYFKVRLI